MNTSALTDVIEPLLARCGLELEALDVVAAGRRRVVRVTVDGDGAQGRGPNLDDIAEATREISDALDASDVMGEQAYTLEVSSRGTSRPLTEPKHWRRNAGRLVKITTVETEPIVGRIVESDDERVIVEVVTDARKRLTERVEVAYAEMTKALIQVEMNRRPGPEDGDESDDNEDDDELDEDELDDEEDH